MNDVLAGLVERPAVEGLFGPESLTWEVVRETGLLLGGGRALLLQLAHPAIAAAVAENSTFQADPLRRSLATQESMHAVVFADRAGALAVAERVRSRHEGIRGSVPGTGARYAGTDPALAWWVLATLFDTMLQVFPLLVRPLSASEAERLYAESRISAVAFGLPLDALPPDLDAFRRRFAATLATLGPTPLALEQLQELRRHLPAFLGQAAAAVEQDRLFWRILGPRPAQDTSRWIFELLTAGLLPPALREAWGLPWGRGAEVSHRLAFRAIGRAYRAVPTSLRFHEAWHAADLRVREAR